MVDLGVRFEAGGKRGMSEIINQQGENNKPGQDEGKLKHTGTDDEAMVSV